MDAYVLWSWCANGSEQTTAVQTPQSKWGFTMGNVNGLFAEGDDGDFKGLHIPREVWEENEQPLSYGRNIGRDEAHPISWDIDKVFDHNVGDSSSTFEGDG